MTHLKIAVGPASGARRWPLGRALAMALLATSCQAPPALPLATAGDPGASGAPVRVPPSSEQPDHVPELRVRATGLLGPGGGVLLIDLAPPEGAKLTLDAPLSARGSGGIGLGFPHRLSGPLSEHALPLRLPIDVADGATGPARVELSYFWCTDGNEAACRREQAILHVELDLTGSGAGGEAHLNYRARGEI